MIKKLLIVILHVLLISCPLAGMQSAFGQQLPLTSEAVSSSQDKQKTFVTDVGKKYLVLNKAPRIGKFRRYRFIAGQEVNFKVKNERKRFKTKILSISDSSFTIDNDLAASIEPREIMLSELRLFKISRRIPFVSEAAYYFPIGGLLYIGADFFNKGIDDKRFTTDASAFIVGGTLMLAGLICHKLSSHTIKINNKNTLRVLSSD
ncbi:hypothetical protein [Dyadobacter bucti]|uniref:hypothetical protein n=1 Tax=Dyadobacter bucti TaxID=2572203 RepID=UPI0011082C17|nr:hypothetical protein [Dyadobacter bucti]